MIKLFLSCNQCDEDVEVLCDGDNPIICSQCFSVDDFKEIEND